MTKAELVERNKKLEADKEMYREQKIVLTGKLAAIRAIMDS